MLSGSEVRLARVSNRLLRWLPKRLVRAVVAVSRRAVVLLSEPAEAEGFQIIDMADDAGAPGRVQRVAAAVMLLKRADPLRFQRIRGDCPRIGIIPTVGSGGEYWSSPKMGEEKAFARRLPNSDEWVKYVERKTLDPSYWTDAAVAARTQKAFDDLVMVPDRGTV